jgi:hypothetical protein
MEGIHLKNEARCQYYRDVYKGLTVPDRVYQAIKSNEPSFLASSSDYGCMSDYRIIANTTSQTAWMVIWEQGIGKSNTNGRGNKNTPCQMTTGVVGYICFLCSVALSNPQQFSKGISSPLKQKHKRDNFILLILIELFCHHLLPTTFSCILYFKRKLRSSRVWIQSIRGVVIDLLFVLTYCFTYHTACRYSKQARQL